MNRRSNIEYSINKKTRCIKKTDANGKYFCEVHRKCDICELWYHLKNTGSIGDQIYCSNCWPSEKEFEKILKEMKRVK